VTPRVAAVRFAAGLWRVWARYLRSRSRGIKSWRRQQDDRGSGGRYAADQPADFVLSVSLKKMAMDPLEPRFEMSFIKNHHQAIRRRALGNEIQPQIGNSSQGQSRNARLLD
jgi:hypothetical protein